MYTVLHSQNGVVALNSNYNEQYQLFANDFTSVPFTRNQDICIQPLYESSQYTVDYEWKNGVLYIKRPWSEFTIWVNTILVDDTALAGVNKLTTTWFSLEDIELIQATNANSKIASKSLANGTITIDTNLSTESTVNVRIYSVRVAGQWYYMVNPISMQYKFGPGLKSVINFGTAAVQVFVNES